MDKEKILEYARIFKFNGGTISLYAFNEVIDAYLRDVAPQDTWDKIPEFIGAVLKCGNPTPYYERALMHFCSKFNVVEMYSKPDRYGRTTLLAIY